MSRLTPRAYYEPLPSVEVARRVGFRNHDTAEEIKTLQAMIQNPPFPAQSNSTELEEFLHDKLESAIREAGSPTRGATKIRLLKRQAGWARRISEQVILKRMSQLMTMGGYAAEAREWAETQGQ